MILDKFSDQKKNEEEDQKESISLILFSGKVTLLAIQMYQEGNQHWAMKVGGRGMKMSYVPNE